MGTVTRRALLGASAAIVIAIAAASFWPNHITDAEIHAAIGRDQWVLACALDAYYQRNGLDFGFDMWWELGDDNWMRSIRTTLPSLTEQRYKAFLREYAAAHGHLTSDHIMAAARNP